MILSKKKKEEEEEEEKEFLCMMTTYHLQLGIQLSDFLSPKLPTASSMIIMLQKH